MFIIKMFTLAVSVLVFSFSAPASQLVMPGAQSSEQPKDPSRLLLYQVDVLTKAFAKVVKDSQLPRERQEQVIGSFKQALIELGRTAESLPVAGPEVQHAPAALESELSRLGAMTAHAYYYLKAGSGNSAESRKAAITALSSVAQAYLLIGNVNAHSFDCHESVAKTCFYPGLTGLGGVLLLWLLHGPLDSLADEIASALSGVLVATGVALRPLPGMTPMWRPEFLRKFAGFGGQKESANRSTKRFWTAFDSQVARLAQGTRSTFDLEVTLLSMKAIGKHPDRIWLPEVLKTVGAHVMTADGQDLCSGMLEGARP